MADQDLIFIGFGFLVLMIGIASFSIQMTMRRNARERQRTEANREGGQTVQSPADKAIRADAVAEAIRRDPSLTNASTPEELSRLDEMVQGIQKEWQLKRELEAVKAAERRKLEQEQHARRLAKEAEDRRLASQEQARRSRLEAERRAREQEQKIAAMPPLRRFLRRFWIPVSLGFLVLVVFPAIAGVWWLLQSQKERTLLASCDWNEYVKVRAYSNWADEWIQCADPTVRANVILNAPDGFLTSDRLTDFIADESDEVRDAAIMRAPLDYLTEDRIKEMVEVEGSLPALENRVLSSPESFSQNSLLLLVGNSQESFRDSLAQSGNLSSEIRQALVEAAFDDAARACETGTAAYEIAKRLGREEDMLAAWASCDEPESRLWVVRSNSTPAGVLATLADDDSEAVRARLTGNQNTPPEVLIEFANDPSLQVRTALAASPFAPREALQVLADDPEPAVRASLAGNSNAPVQVLRQLANDEDPQVRSVLRENEALP